VLITADHGESLLEHGVFFDHHSLYEPVAKVPLIFVLPDELIPTARRRINTPVTHVDLLPTILELAQIQLNEKNLEGQSLIPLILGEAEDIKRPILIEEHHFEKKHAIRLGQYKVICAPDPRLLSCQFCGHPHGDRQEVFNLESDPQEVKNLASEEPELLKMMDQLFTGNLVS
jgi:arylsulfatase A-like enzyme